MMLFNTVDFSKFLQMILPRKLGSTFLSKKKGKASNKEQPTSLNLMMLLVCIQHPSSQSGPGTKPAAAGMSHNLHGNILPPSHPIYIARFVCDVPSDMALSHAAAQAAWRSTCSKSSCTATIESDPNLFPQCITGIQTGACMHSCCRRKSSASCCSCPILS